MFTNIYNFWCNDKPYMVSEHRSQVQFPRATSERGCLSIDTTAWYNRRTSGNFLVIGPCAGFQMFINICRFWCNGKPYMVSELLWRAAFGFDQDLELVLPKLFLRVSGSRFSMHLWPVGAIPLRPERRFHLEIVFVSPKTVSVCSRNTHFRKSEGIMLQWRICFFFKSLIFYQFIIRSFMF